jgi:hypothetical protein
MCPSCFNNYHCRLTHPISMQLLYETYMNVMNIYYLQQIIYFIYILFYDAFSSKDYIQLNDNIKH